ncbi:MAG: VOC family protein [Anaerolineales bacterium]|nr:VOC family protein [Anaerolineales bacterium]
MNIEHIAFWVYDLDAFCAFYEHNFGASVGPLYENPANGFRSRFLSFSTGARIEAMTTTTLSPIQLPDGAQRMGLTHIAVSLGSESAVDKLTAELKAQGVPVLDGPRRTGDGYYESVILDPEGNRLELTV